MSGFGNIFNGINGQPEIIRSLGAFGMLCYILGALGFQAWAMIRGDHFDVVTFCAAFAGGLVSIYVGIAGGAALKDRNVAVAQTVATTGALPAQPAQGATP